MLASKEDGHGLVNCADRVALGEGSFATSGPAVAGEVGLLKLVFDLVRFCHF